MHANVGRGIKYSFIIVPDEPVNGHVFGFALHLDVGMKANKEIIASADFFINASREQNLILLMRCNKGWLI